MNNTQKLRLVLRFNATFSLVCGVVALMATGWVSEGLGFDHLAITRLLGIGLVGWFALVTWISTFETDRLVRETAYVSAADFSWVVGTVVVIATGVLTTAGVWVGVAIAALVADLGVTQLVLRSKEAAPAATATIAA